MRSGRRRHKDEMRKCEVIYCRALSTGKKIKAMELPLPLIKTLKSTTLSQEELIWELKRKRNILNRYVR